MKKDLELILGGWQYDSTTINARWVDGSDGRKKVQLRLDLGLLQMEISGRPDGTTPRGYPTLLDYYLLLEKTSPPQDRAISLNTIVCAELQQEAVQFYYRHLSFYSLNYLDGVILDTEHNIQLFEFADRHAESDELTWQFLQFYPYVRMMNARARAEQAVEGGILTEAIRSLQEGLHDIQQFAEDRGLGEVGVSHEVDVLSDLLNQVENKKPKTEIEQVREELAQAILGEDYEKAAILRDQIISLKQTDVGLVEPGLHI